MGTRAAVWNLYNKRFGLPLLLLAVGAVAVFCGWARRQVDFFQAQQAAIGEKRARGVEVFTEPAAGEWFWELIAPGAARMVTGISYIEPEAKCEPNDGDWAWIRRWSDLRSLRLKGAYVTDEKLAGLSCLPSLEFVVLVDTGITDDGLITLAGCKKAKFVHIRSRIVGDRGMQAVLSNCRGLVGFGIEGATLSESAFGDLENLSKFLYLALMDCRLSEGAIERLCQVRNVQSLDTTPDAESLAALQRIEAAWRQAEVRFIYDFVPRGYIPGRPKHSDVLWPG